MPTVGSLFSGVGGFDLGFEREGFDVAYQVEFDKHAQSVLRRHWPDTPLFEDVRNVGAANLPAVDVLVGGFPCQDLSVAGRRAGLAGERSGLFYEFARVIEESNPEWVVIENVAGLLSSRGGRDMGAVLGTLSELGYGWAYRVLDSQYLGVAQRRRRVFIVGRSGGRSRSCAEVLFERESVLGNPPPSRAKGQEVAGTIGGRSARSHTELDGHGAYVVGHPITFAIQDCREIEKHQGGLGDTQSEVGYTLDGTGAQGFAYIPAQVGTLSDGAHHGGGLNGQDAYSGRVLAPCGVPRRLTPLECERLQGFPDHWTEGQADSHRYRQMGNAVTVPVAQWIARQVLQSRLSHLSELDWNHAQV